MTTNPDNVGGLRELANDVHARFFWMVSPDKDGNHLVTDESVKAVVRLAELCRAAPTRGECDKFRPGAPCQSPGSCRENGCSAVERELFAHAGGDDVDTLLSLVPRPAMAHHKMDEAEEREIKRVNRFRDHVIENIRAHCASRPVSAPAGSGEVGGVIARLEECCVDADGSPLGDLHDPWGVSCDLLREAAALLRKLQQGADAPKES